jgi:hypothetical protein
MKNSPCCDRPCLAEVRRKLLQKVCPYFCFCPSQTKRLTYHRYNSLCICASRIVPSTATRKADPQRWGLTRGSRYFESTKWLSDSEVPDCATPPRVPALGNILKVGTATPESIGWALRTAPLLLASPQLSALISLQG